MGSFAQFVCGAAVGVAVFVAVTNLQRRVLVVSQNPNPSHSIASESSNQDGITQERVLHTIQSAATPMRRVQDEPRAEERTTTTTTSHGNDTSEQQDDDGQNLLNLLYNIAEDQAKKEGYIHRGITCNTCQASPICGVRYKCANCVDYDICERCETQDCHNKIHVFLKIPIPIPPLANPRTPCTTVLYPGKKNHPCQLSWDEMQRLKNDTHFDLIEIEALVEQFKTLATEDAGITREIFDQCLGPLGQHKNLVMEQMFKFYDQGGDNIIDLEEFVQALSILVKGSQQEKIPFAFKGYDIEGKGHITRENLRNMFKAYFNVSLELVRDVVRSCEEEMMASFDDAADKPVSAIFNAPIPNHGGPSTSGKPAQHYQNPGSLRSGQDGMWPVMEAMSQDAIDEMVENVFKHADLDDNGEISFEEFKTWAANDNTLLAWFEALGTVF